MSSSISQPQKVALLKKGVNEGLYPEKVYKFRSISKALKIIVNLEFYFASADSFNDPFDCSLDDVSQYAQGDLDDYVKTIDKLSTQAEIEGLKKAFTRNSTELSSRIKEIKKKYINQRGILALSEEKSNILLWSHYSDNHQGLTIELDLLGDPEFFLFPRKMEYKSEYKPINYLKDPEASINTILQTKSIDWSYEKELRIYKAKSGLYKINPLAITGIYFGVKTSDEDIRTIRNACNNNLLNHVNFYQAKKIFGEFKLEFIKI